MPIAFVQREFPLGTIQAWYGSIATIPGTWRLCDGNNGTPDLRNKFIIGSGDTYSAGDTGGSINHNHDFTGGGHMHTAVTAPGLSLGANFTPTTSIDPATGTTDNADKRPPYYSLAYIMYAGRTR